MLNKNPKLSILVCSVLNRGTTFLPKLIEQLDAQLKLVDHSDVELLILTDNKHMSVGAKRNKLVDMASGDYCIFIDDDDRISDDYISSILEATATQKDAIVFNASVSVNGGAPKTCHYSITNKKNYNTADAYYRLPNHITAIKTSIARRVRFPEISFSEDTQYAERLSAEVHTEHMIDRTLYFYDYDDYSSETVRHDVDRPRVSVDIIILSKATSKEIIAMTQHAIDTAIENTIQNLNIIVLEQAEGVTYQNAKTIYKNEAFNYNAFANYGASLGNSEWIIIANNDLEFTRAWLEELLAANHNLVSPHEPNDYRQIGLTADEVGKTVGRNISGWCFMIKRSLWEQIGEFDTDVDFWCSDNVVVEQCSTFGVQPMIVKKSVVKHLGSQTLITSPNYSDLTWKNVAIFNEKYCANEFDANRQFTQWKVQNRSFMDEIQKKYRKKLDVTVIIATFGSKEWEELGKEAAETARLTGAEVLTLHLDNGTLAQARNQAMQQVKTEYLCFLDADDSLPSDYFNIRPTADITATRISYSGSLAQRLYVYRHNRIGGGHIGSTCSPECLKAGNYVHIGAIMKTEIAKRIQFREYPVYEDWAYFLEQSLHGATFGYADTVYLAATRHNPSHRNSDTPMNERNLTHAQIVKDLL